MKLFWLDSFDCCTRVLSRSLKEHILRLGLCYNFPYMGYAGPVYKYTRHAHTCTVWLSLEQGERFTYEQLVH